MSKIEWSGEPSQPIMDCAKQSASCNDRQPPEAKTCSTPERASSSPRVQVEKLKHLQGALRLVSPRGLNLCVHRAAAFVLDVPGAEMRFGSCPAASEEERQFHPEVARAPFIHAWTEFRGFVPLLNRPDVRTGIEWMTAGEFREFMKPFAVFPLRRPDLLQVSRRIGLSSHLRLGIPAKEKVGVALLNAAHVPWEDNGYGGIAPSALRDKGGRE